MKKSIFIAFSILLLVVGWIGSGQFTNVNAQDDTFTSTESNTETVEKVKEVNKVIKTKGVDVT